MIVIYIMDPKNVHFIRKNQMLGYKTKNPLFYCILKKNNVYIRSVLSIFKDMKTMLLSSVLLILFSSIKAQTAGKLFDRKNSDYLEKKIEILNTHLTNCKIEHDDKRFTVTYYEKGEPYRIDYIYLETLDSNKIYYSAEEKMVILKCKGEDELEGKLKKFKDGCIERHILKNEVIRAYFRINFDVTGNRDEFISTFRELVVTSQDEVHKHD